MSKPLRKSQSIGNADLSVVAARYADGYGNIPIFPACHADRYGHTHSYSDQYTDGF